MRNITSRPKNEEVASEEVYLSDIFNELTTITEDLLALEKKQNVAAAKRAVNKIIHLQKRTLELFKKRVWAVRKEMESNKITKRKSTNLAGLKPRTKKV
jgi:hypothetical protein